MFINLLQAQLFFYFVLLLFVYCTLCNCEKLTISETPPASNSVSLFQNDKVQPLKPNPTSNQDKEEQITLKNIDLFFYLLFDSLMVTLTSVKDDSAGENNLQTHLLAKYIEMNEENMKINVFKTNKEDAWKTQLVTKNTPQADNKYFELITSAVDVQKNKIYVFVVNGTEVETNSQYISYNNVEITLVVGTINTEVKLKQAGKTIKWEEKKLSKLSTIDKVKSTSQEKITKFLINDAISFVTEDGKVLLIFKGKEDVNKNENIIALINVKESENNLDFLHVDNIGSCNPFFFSWKNEIIMITTNCQSKSTDNMIKFTDMEKWVDSTGPFFRLWELLQNKKDFTPATFGSSKLLFFTQQGIKDSTSSGEEQKYYLFVSDGTRVKKIGHIATDIVKDKPIRLLITDKELFTLHEKLNSNGDYTSIILTHQKELLTKTQLVVDAWSRTDDIIKQQCTSSSEKQTLCIKKLPTDSVVGFLSNNESTSSDNNVFWHDEYYYVNATVEGGEKTKNGFQFNTPEARAVWPVGKPEDGTPYNFASFGFTLVVTVNIDKSSELEEEQRPLLGVTLKDDKIGVGIFCSKEKMMIITDSAEISKKDVPNKKCVKEKQYYVTLVYNSSKVFVYIDWELVGGGHDFKIEKSVEKNLQFYFGVDSKNNKKIVASYTTITNVLLYNRPFTSDEIITLKSNNKNEAPPTPKHDESEIDQDINSDGRDLHTNDEHTKENEAFLYESTTQTNNEEDILLHPKESTIHVGVSDVVLGVLFFVLLNIGVEITY